MKPKNNTTSKTAGGKRPLSSITREGLKVLMRKISIISVILMATKTVEINMIDKEANMEIIEAIIMIANEVIEGSKITVIARIIEAIKETKKAEEATTAAIGATISVTGRVTIITKEIIDHRDNMTSRSRKSLTKTP